MRWQEQQREEGKNSHTRKNETVKRKENNETKIYTIDGGMNKQINVSFSYFFQLSKPGND